MATEEKVNLNVNEYVDYLDTDEDMSSGGIDYDNVDAPKDWDTVTDSTDKKIKRAVMERRIITRGFISQEVWLPVIKLNEDKEAVLGYNVFRRSPKSRGSLLDQINLVEKRLNSGKSDKDLQTKYSTSFWYLGFCNDDAEVKLKWLKYNITIKKAIQEFQTKPSTKDPDMLLFGPSLLYDVIITKTINEHEKGMRQYSYTVIPEPSQTKWLHQIPTTFWNKKDGGFKSSFDLIVHGGLSEEQVEAIADFQREYDGLLLNTIARTYLKPHGDDEVISLLSKNPLNQFALKDGIPIFGDKPELFVAAITEIADIKTLKSKEDLPKVEEETPGMPEEDVPLPQEPTETATAEVVNTEKISEPEPEDTKFPPDENTPKPKKSPFDEKADPEKEEKPIETTTKETSIDTSEVGDPWPQE